jgi:uncharacterized membrane protein required for colicin V production
MAIISAQLVLYWDISPVNDIYESYLSIIAAGVISSLYQESYSSLIRDSIHCQIIARFIAAIITVFSKD